MNHVNENVNLMVANVTQIKTETMINAHASERTKKKMCARRVIFSILLHAVVKMVDIEKALMMIH